MVIHNIILYKLGTANIITDPKESMTPSPFFIVNDNCQSVVVVTEDTGVLVSLLHQTPQLQGTVTNTENNNDNEDYLNTRPSCSI